MKNTFDRPYLRLQKAEEEKEEVVEKFEKDFGREKLD